MKKIIILSVLLLLEILILFNVVIQINISYLPAPAIKMYVKSKTPIGIDQRAVISVLSAEKLLSNGRMIFMYTMNIENYFVQNATEYRYYDPEERKIQITYEISEIKDIFENNNSINKFEADYDGINFKIRVYFNSIYEKTYISLSYNWRYFYVYTNIHWIFNSDDILVDIEINKKFYFY